MPKLQNEKTPTRNLMAPQTIPKGRQNVEPFVTRKRLNKNENETCIFIQKGYLLITT